MRIPTVAVLAVLTALLVAPSTLATEYATSSTGNVDTWWLPEPVPSTEGCSVSTRPVGAELGCLIEMCPAYVGVRDVVLRLLDARPGDVVALAVSGGQGPRGSPVAYATYERPEARVTMGIAGCATDLSAVVTGVLVDGEVSYSIGTAPGTPFSITAPPVCLKCPLLPVHLP